MNTLTISPETRPHHLENFCGDALRQWTGVTKVKTESGEITIGMGDTIVKHDDGTFDVYKEENNLP